jgi:hypothetical protein
VGTSFGSTLLRRYLQNTKWVKDSTSAEEMKKFQTNLELFQKYAGEYSFDYLMIAETLCWTRVRRTRAEWWASCR